MAGGPSTPELAIAAANAGGLGFIAGGYLTGSTLRAAIDAVRAETSAPLGVNLFVPSVPAPRERVDAYAATLHHEAERLGAQLGAARWDADAFDEKIDALMKATPHLVTFTFGTPDSDAVDRLHRGGAQIGVTVTATGEARLAAEAGADVLIVQGTEAGGHQGTFTGEAANETPLLDALQQIHDVALPMIATGGIVTAADAKAAMDAGAIGVQIGTALLCTPEAATTALHRRALLGKMFADTVVTRAYSGRYARGLRNRFAREHLDAPNAYPEIHYLTRPLRQAATAAGDADVPNFWAGANWGSIREASAAEVIRSLATGL
ncbi:MAG: nitronate monooxygenase [Pseudonocardiales bacterium]|jgi:nitronate monooxygenase|nr:nitronate monooxygenase [Pseudonocardiales bacterium]